jgi:hypothetical protein
MRSKVAKVGAMLGHFSVLGAIFRVLGVLGHFVGEFDASSSFWGRLGPSRARVWKVLGRAGGGFGRLGGLFSPFFRTFALGLRESLDLYKTLAGAVKIKVCALTRCTKIHRKSDPRAFRTKVPAKNAPKMHLGAYQGRFWGGLEHLGRILAAF